MKSFALFFVVLASVVTAQARSTFDSCGLGWDVTDKKTVLATSTRGTTNSFVPPTFGMTTGTLGCEKFQGFAANEKESASFVAKNFDSIRGQLAIGSGEYVDATAQSFGCDSASFGAHVQQNYNTVVAPAQDGVELYQNLKQAAQNACS